MLDLDFLQKMIPLLLDRSQIIGRSPLLFPLQVQTSLFATEKRGRKTDRLCLASPKAENDEGFFACQGTCDRSDGCFKAIDEMEGEAFIFAP